MKQKILEGGTRRNKESQGWMSKLRKGEVRVNDPEDSYIFPCHQIQGFPGRRSETPLYQSHAFLI
jgi:hypothetical protein